MVQSKYLKQSDVPDPVIVTIQGVKQVNVAKDDEAPEMKWAIKFMEFDKPMILNSTNLHVAAKVIGSDETNDWRGKEIILFTDPNVSFGGQVVGGLRFRGQEKAPVKAATPRQPQAAARPVAVAAAGGAKPAGNPHFDDMEDEIPF